MQLTAIISAFYAGLTIRGPFKLSARRLFGQDEAWIESNDILLLSVR